MVMKTAVINGLTPTAIGTVNYTSPGFGTVQGVIVVVSHTTAATNPNAGASISIGVASSNGQYVTGVSAADAVASSDTYRALDNTRVVRLPNFATASFCVASFSSFIADGVTLDFAFTNSTQYRISIILIGGCTDIEVYEKVATGTGPHTVTLAMTSKPNLIFGLGTGSGAFATAPASIAIASLGAAHISSTNVVTQVYQGFTSNDAVADEQASTLVRDNAFAGQIHASAESWYAYVTGASTGQFTFSASTGPAGDYVVGLAINTGDADGVKLSVESTPTTTGTKTVTAPGWQPQSVILGVTGHPTTNTINNFNPVAWGIGGYDGTNQFCHAIDVDDAAATMDTQTNFSSSNGVQAYDGSGGHALLVEGAFTGFTSTGYTMNFPTTVSATARKFLSIAIRAEVGGGGTTLQLTAAPVAATGKPLNVSAATLLHLTMATTVAVSAASIELIAATVLATVNAAVGFVGKTLFISNNLALQLTAAAVNFAAKSTTITWTTLLSMTAATMRFSRKSFSFGGAVARHFYRSIRSSVMSSTKKSIRKDQ